jgi:hypothetical protein
MKLKYLKEITIHALLLLLFANCEQAKQATQPADIEGRAQRRTERLDSLLGLSPDQKMALHKAHVSYLQVMDEYRPEKGEKISMKNRAKLLQSAQELEQLYRNTLDSTQYTTYLSWKARRRAARKMIPKQ